MFLFTSSIILIISYLFFIPISKNLKINSNTFNFFFLLNFVYLFIFVYFHFIGLGTDAKSFYNNHFKYNVKYLPVSDNLIYGINYFSINYFNLSFENLNLISFFPKFMCTLLILSLVDKDKNKLNKFIVFGILILPTFNFFSSGLNKDMLIYCSLCIFIYSLIKEKKILLTISLIFVFLVRPYVALSILISIPIALTTYIILNSNHFQKKFNIKNFIISILLFLIAIFSIYFISDNLLGSFGKNFLKGDISTIMNNLQGHYIDTPLGISNNINFLSRIFHYLFYPSLWNPIRYDLFFYIMILENTFLLLIFFYFILYINFIKIRRLNSILGFCSFLILLMILSLLTSNYGIAFRQKWMIIPFLVLLFINNSKLFNFNSNLTNKKISQI